MIFHHQQVSRNNRDIRFRSSCHRERERTDKSRTGQRSNHAGQRATTTSIDRFLFVCDLENKSTHRNVTVNDEQFDDDDEIAILDSNHGQSSHEQMEAQISVEPDSNHPNEVEVDDDEPDPGTCRPTGRFSSSTNVRFI